MKLPLILQVYQEMGTILAKYTHDPRIKDLQTLLIEILDSKGYSPNDIAPILGISASTVKRRLESSSHGT